MKFLHTADWHIGKLLHKHSLAEEMQIFFDWLIDTIETHEVDVLLVAGDIFDLANPSIEDRAVYYRILLRLSKVCKHVIITGGNHDSVGMLEAPAQILQVLHIDVIGGAHRDDHAREIIPLLDTAGQVQALVLAVPYLRDRDIKTFIGGQTYEDQAAATRAGIIAHYAALAALAREQYGPDLPIIGMGHLYLSGVTTSDSERDITVGNLDAVDHQSLTKDMAYLALGHIHRPQTVDADGRIKYSGSPIPLSFSERQDHKRVVVGEISEGKIELSSIPVPIARPLRSITGRVEEVENALAQYQPDSPLPAYVEIHVTEDRYDPSIPARLDTLRQRYADAPFYIIKERTSYSESPTHLSELYHEGTHVEDLSPQEVFDRLLDTEAFAADTEAELRSAFQSLLEEVWQQEKK